MLDGVLVDDSLHRMCTHKPRCRLDFKAMKSLMIYLCIALLASTRASAQHNNHNHEAPAAVHGMVLFGTDTLYASHVPMFMVPHDWQALLQVELSHPTVNANAAYASLLQEGVQPLVTLRPKPFVLPKLLEGQIVTFEATMHRGNFEQGGPVVLSGVTVTVKDVTYKAQLSTATQALSELTYLPIITEAGAYLAHKISGPNNFDHIVQVTWDGPAIAELVLDGVSDSAASRLKAGQVLTVGHADGQTTTVKVISDFYCTPGPDFFGDCG